jgi:hypothetical protein
MRQAQSMTLMNVAHVAETANGVLQPLHLEVHFSLAVLMKPCFK